MAAWHRSQKADIGLRSAGLCLWWTAYWAVSALIALHVSAQTANVSAYVLAAAGFLAASSGSALVLVGAHLFDQVPISARWHSDFTEIDLLDSRAPAQLNDR